MSRKMWATWCALMLAAVAGCSDDDGEGAGNKDEFIAQLCAEFSSCCAAAGLPADGAQCRALYGALTPASGYDAVAADACLAEVRASSDKCAMSSGSMSSCRQVFGSAGTQQPGETCEDDNDCAAPESGEVECVTDFVDGGTIKQCQVRLPGEAGSTPCIGTVDGNVTFSSGVDGIPPSGYLCDVADGLMCDGQTGACERLAAVGEACSTGQYACIPSAFCGSNGQCQPRIAPGGACQRQGECQAGAYCDLDALACAAARELGEACTSSAECKSDNCTNLKCEATNDLTLVFVCGSN